LSGLTDCQYDRLSRQTKFIEIMLEALKDAHLSEFWGHFSVGVPLFPEFPVTLTPTDDPLRRNAFLGSFFLSVMATLWGSVGLHAAPNATLMGLGPHPVLESFVLDDARLESCRTSFLVPLYSRTEFVQDPRGRFPSVTQLPLPGAVLYNPEGSAVIIAASMTFAVLKGVPLVVAPRGAHPPPAYDRTLRRGSTMARLLAREMTHSLLVRALFAYHQQFEDEEEDGESSAIFRIVVAQMQAAISAINTEASVPSDETAKGVLDAVRALKRQPQTPTPRAIRASAKWEPMNPAPPVMSTRMGVILF
jgi:hypothetical protein